MRMLALGGILFLMVVISGYQVWGSLLEPVLSGPAPQVGRLAPGFSLSDASGSIVSLAEFRWTSSVVLLFASSYQSPALEHQLLDLHTQERGLDTLRVEVITITSEQPHALLPRLGALGPLFHLLFDPERRAIHAFQVEVGDQVFPAAFVIDRQGKIRFRYVGSRAEDAAEVGAIIRALGGL